MTELSSEAVDPDGDVRSIAEVERYVRQRQQEADLLVAKARRLLVAAEEKAAVIVAAARARAVAPPDPDVQRPQVIDLDGWAAVGAPRHLAPQADGAAAGAASRADEQPGSGLDRLLASAIANAVDHAFAGDGRT